MATRVDRQRQPKNRLLAVLLFVSMLYPLQSLGENHNVQEIKPFGLLDISGNIRVGYLFDERDFSGHVESRATWEEEFFLLSRSYVYHPGFLNMDFGGGPVLVQQQFSLGGDETSHNDTLLNLLARLNFLELKNYPFSFYFQRTHPSVTRSLAGRFLTQNDVVGFNGRVFDLLGGATSIRLAAESRSAEGSSLGWIVDENNDSASVLVETSYRRSDRLQLKYDRLDTESASGSPGLPIFRSSIAQQISEIRSTNRFGGDDRFEVIQILRRLQQDTESASTTTLDDRSYRADMRWKHSDKTRSYFRLRRYDTQRTSSDSESRNVELGFVRLSSENLSFNSAVEYESAKQTGFRRDFSSLRGSFTYNQSIGIGTWGLSGSLIGKRTDQESSGSGIQVFDELHILNGTTPVDLLNEFIIAGSVLVNNAGRTQVYVEGLDYRLLVIGSVTSVQRLIGGNITDGETVAVDYSHETTGTAEFDTLGSGITLNVGFLDTMNAYLRYNRQDTSLRNGEFTNPVNDGKGLELGVGASNQFLDGWSLSGQYRHRIQDEEISPFVSDAVDVSFTTNIRGLWTMTIAGGLSVVDFENSVEDINQVNYRLGLRGRVFRGGQLGYELAYLSDTGGSTPRKQVQHRVNFQWAYRQVRFVLRALYSADELGVTDRSTTQVTAQLTRVF